MKEATARERVLKNIRNALMQKNENPYFNVSADEAVYAPVDPIKEIAFAEALTQVSGNFVYCSDERDMLMQLAGLIMEREWEEVFTFVPEIADILKGTGIKVCSEVTRLPEMMVGITFCESLIARLGTVVVSSFASDGRRMVVHPEVHLVIGYASQVVPDIKDALAGLSARYGDAIPSFISFITGPSRTADIEKTLVMGAHGPRELFVFLIDDQQEEENPEDEVVPEDQNQ